MNKKFSHLLVVICAALMLFLVVPGNNASAAELIYSKNNTTAQGLSSTNQFYTTTGKVTVKVNILSIHNPKSSLQVSLLKPAFFGGDLLATSQRYTTTGIKTITYDFGKAGYYKINLALGGFTGFSSPTKFYTVTSIYE